jgi:bifunctional NMN adenylyltransferase/nudix hydrolase
MKKQFDYLVFIGRIQPLHIGHEEVIKRALELATQVVILVGSSNQPRTIKNPFTYVEREKMILDTLFESSPSRMQQSHVLIAPLQDQKYNDQAWAASVQKTVEQELVKANGWTDRPLRGGIIGHSKDESSYYLQLFPQWEVVEHAINEVVHATDIRDIYFESNLRYLSGIVPKTVFEFLTAFSKKTEYSDLVAEQVFIKKYKKSWEAAPYAPTFVTSDAVAVQSGHVLLIKRKASPGKGLYALPGGFVNQTERIEDGMIRELREETKIKVPAPVLRGSIKASKVFDHPNRSLRGRTITQAFYIELPSGKLPVVKGGDDAADAKWILLSHVREEEMFEDHFSIIQEFLGKL